jgi:hypothetical protein
MNNRRWTWVLTFIVALGLALGGARGAAANSTVDHLPQTKTPSSGKFVMSGSISSEGQTIPISGSGAFSGNNAMLDLTLTAPEGTTSGPDKIMLGVVALDDKLYFKISGLGGETDDQWYVTDLDELTTGMPGAVVGMPGSLTDLDPMLHAAISSKQVGKEAINGAPTTKYQLDVDLEQLITATGGSTEGLENSTLTMLLWVGDNDMYVHQFSMMLDAESSSGDITVSIMMDFTITFSDLDKPVTITAPADAEPLDLGPLLSGGMTGMGRPIMGMPGQTAGMPRSGAGQSDNTMPVALLALGLCLVLSGVAVRRTAYSRRNI